MNILVATNDKYLNYVKTMLCSVISHSSEKVEVYFMYTKLKQNNILNFKNFFKNKYNVAVHFIVVDLNDLKGFKIGTDHFSQEMYFRLFAQFYMPNTMDKILWLDADIIVNGDLCELYNKEFCDNKLIAIKDANCESMFMLKHKRELEIGENKQYFNSGVLLINLDELRKFTSIDLICNVILKLNDRLLYPDQDVLNVLYGDETLYVGDKYNYQVNGGIDANLDKCKQAVIIHYTSMRKPWNPRYMNEFSVFYWNQYNAICGTFKYKVYTILCGIIKTMNFEGALQLIDKFKKKFKKIIKKDRI